MWSECGTRCGGWGRGCLHGCRGRWGLGKGEERQVPLAALGLLEQLISCLVGFGVRKGRWGVLLAVA